MIAKIVLVEWLDAYHESGYFDIHKAETSFKPIKLQEVGWLVVNDTERVVLAQEQCPEDGNYRNLQVIPKAVVVTIKDLTYTPCGTDKPYVPKQETTHDK